MKNSTISLASDANVGQADPGWLKQSLPNITYFIPAEMKNCFDETKLGLASPLLGLH